MSVNAKKSCWVRVGQRFSVKCKDISSLNNHTLPWVKEMKYLGVYFIQARTFCCSIDHATANSIFGKIGRIASKEVTLQLVKSKLFLYYHGLKACPLNKSQLASLDFVINQFFMKLFNTNSMETVKACQEYFSFELPSIQLEKRKKNWNKIYVQWIAIRWVI